MANTCKVQGKLALPNAAGVTGILFLELFAPASQQSQDNTYARIVPNVPIAITVVNGVVTPTDIIASGSFTTISYYHAFLVMQNVGRVLDEIWAINSVGGIFDVGALVPINYEDSQKVVQVSSAVTQLSISNLAQMNIVSQDNTNTIFTLDNVATNVWLFRNGIKQHSDDFTLAGNTLTLAGNPLGSNEQLEVYRVNYNISA